MKKIMMSAVTAFALVATTAFAGPDAKSSMSSMQKSEGCCDLKSPWFLRVAAGPNLVEDIKLTGLGQVLNNKTLKFDVGSHLEIAHGYTFNKYFSMEGELAWMTNEISNGNGTFDQGTLGINALGHYWHVANTNFTPYAGLGGGVQLLAFRDVDLFTSSGLREIAADGYTVRPMIQGFAGVKYDFTNWFDVNLTYKYTTTVGDIWDPMWGDMGDSGPKVDVDDVVNHSILLGVNFRF